MKVLSFPPISNARSQRLVLGSMPGRASLDANQYYAHPQNLFWRFIETLYGIDRTLPYPQRRAGLLREGVAVWDVMQSCVREGSLDADIEESSIIVNAFGEFLRSHPKIRTIAFNGAKAEATYRRYVLRDLDLGRAIEYVRLPSTSPANASIPYEVKIEAWRKGLGV